MSAKTALVTGSTSGIGLAIVHALARKGVNVIITGFGDEKLINSIVNDIKSSYGVRVDYMAADLTKLSDIESLWSDVSKTYPDGIDILINNAGFSGEGPVENIANEQWEIAMALMVTAPFQLIKRCVPMMKIKGYGRIVNTSSINGVIAYPGQCAWYATAKHGLIGLTKCVALETAAHGITCNAICPGVTRTQMLETHIQTVAEEQGVAPEDVRLLKGLTAEYNVTSQHLILGMQNQLLAVCATGKLIEPEQVAELVEFLCLSNASSQMTGATYMIDHGFTAQ